MNSIEEKCKKIERFDQTYQQFFPIPMRVMHGENIQNPNEIITVGLNWVRSDEEARGFMKYLNNAMQGKDSTNEYRHEQQKPVIDRKLIGIYKLKSDDNLGEPF